jgi:hypothetical protein
MHRGCRLKEAAKTSLPQNVAKNKPPQKDAAQKSMPSMLSENGDHHLSALAA